MSGRLPEDVVGLLRNEHDVVARDEDRPMARERLLHEIGDKEGLLSMITDRVDGEMMQRAPNLKMIANCAVGFDNIDLEAATARKIPVSNTPDVLTDATADLAFALILATARRVVEGDKRTRAGKFRFFALFNFLGREVSGKTLGIVGFGRIGRAVARRARGFDMRTLYYKRKRLDAEEEKGLGVTFAGLKDLIVRSDFVTVHVPPTEDTRHLFGLRELEQMKQTAYLINTSRGPVIDEKALVEVLRDGRIAGAALDVYENEPALTPGLIELKNVVLLPHVGSATVETRTAMALKAAKNLLAGLRGERPPDCLNWEDVYQRNPGS